VTCGGKKRGVAVFQPGGKLVKMPAHGHVVAVRERDQGFLNGPALFDGRFEQVQKEPRPFRAAHGQRQDEMAQEKKASANGKPKNREKHCLRQAG
jgi:hypothetical protein